MTDEQIKEITLALIEKGWLDVGVNNTQAAEKIAEFINKLREETNK